MQLGRTTETNNRGSSSVFFAVVVAKMMLKIAVADGALLIGTALLGRKIDAALETEPWLTLALMLIMSLVGMWIAYRIGQNAVALIQSEFPSKKLDDPATQAA